jgi:hypothetical protein
VLVVVERSAASGAALASACSASRANGWVPSIAQMEPRIWSPARTAIARRSLPSATWERDTRIGSSLAHSRWKAPLSLSHCIQSSGTARPRIVRRRGPSIGASIVEYASTFERGSSIVTAPPTIAATALARVKRSPAGAPPSTGSPGAPAVASAVRSRV